jgi:hypothetical protein
MPVPSRLARELTRARLADDATSSDRSWGVSTDPDAADAS